MANGARGVTSPTETQDELSDTKSCFAEVELYGEVVLRYISGDYTGPMMPQYVPVDVQTSQSFGINRLDHCVGNVPNLLETVNYICDFTGMQYVSLNIWISE